MKTKVRMGLLLFIVAIAIFSLSAHSVFTTAVRTEEEVTLQHTNTPVIKETKMIVVEPTTVPTLEPTVVTPIKKYPWGENDTSFGTGEIPKLGIEYPIKMQVLLYEVLDREEFVIHKIAWKNRSSVVLMIHQRGYDLNLLNEGDIFVINSTEGVFTYSLLTKETYVKTDIMKYERELESGEREVIDEEDLALRIYVEENQGLVLQSCIPSPDAQIKILFLTYKRVS